MKRARSIGPGAIVADHEILRKVGEGARGVVFQAKNAEGKQRALKILRPEFGKDDEVRFATVQTVFEGFGTNTEEAAKKLVKKYELDRMPVGHSGSPGSKSKVMADFKTRGTPWTVVIGKDGKVAFEGFHLKIEEGKKLIGKLKSG